MEILIRLYRSADFCETVIFLNTRLEHYIPAAPGRRDACQMVLMRFSESLLNRRPPSISRNRDLWEEGVGNVHARG